MKTLHSKLFKKSAFEEMKDMRPGRSVHYRSNEVPEDVFQRYFAGLRADKPQVLGDLAFQLEYPYIRCPVFQYILEPGGSTLSEALVSPDQMLQE